MRATLVLFATLVGAAVPSLAVEGCPGTFSGIDFVSAVSGFETTENQNYTSVNCADCRNNCESDETCVAYSHVDGLCYTYGGITTLAAAIGYFETTATSGIIYSKLVSDGFTITSAKLSSPYASFGYADNDEPRCRSLCLKDPNCAAYQQPACALSALRGHEQFELDATQTVHLVGNNPPDTSRPELKNIDDIKEAEPDTEYGADRSVTKIYAGTDSIAYYIDAPDDTTKFYAVDGVFDMNQLATAEQFAGFMSGETVTDLKFVIDSFNPPAAVLREYGNGTSRSIYEIRPHDFSMDVTQCDDNKFRFNLFDGAVKPVYGRFTVLSSDPDSTVCSTTALSGDFIEFDMAACGIEFMVPKLYVYHADDSEVGLSTVFNVTCSPDYLSVDVAHSMTDSLANTDYNHVVNEAVFNIDLLVLDQATNAPPVGAPSPEQPLKLVANITDGYRAEFDLRITRCYVNGYMFYDNEGPLNDLTEVAQDIDNASQYINFKLFFPPTNQIINSLTYECNVATCWQSCDPPAEEEGSGSGEPFKRKRRSVKGREYTNVIANIWWTHRHGSGR